MLKTIASSAERIVREATPAQRELHTRAWWRAWIAAANSGYTLFFAAFGHFVLAAALAAGCLLSRSALAEARKKRAGGEA